MPAKQIPKRIKGSMKWIRQAVNVKQNVLDAAIRNQFNILNLEPLEWVSPLAKDGYSEYSDQRFLDQLRINLETKPLEDFWPVRGAAWDALARIRTDPPKILLVEAKARVGELKSSPSNANDSASLEKISTALRKTQEFMGVPTDYDWTGTYYQYANRLAHLYLLRVLNDIDAYLVYVCFLNDVEMKGPTTIAEWQNAIAEAESTLGITDHKLQPYVAHIFIDVNQLGEPKEE